MLPFPLLNVQPLIFQGRSSFIVQLDKHFRYFSPRNSENCILNEEFFSRAFFSPKSTFKRGRRTQLVHFFVIQFSKGEMDAIKASFINSIFKRRIKPRFSPLKRSHFKHWGLIPAIINNNDENNINELNQFVKEKWNHVMSSTAYFEGNLMRWRLFCID